MAWSEQQFQANLSHLRQVCSQRSESHLFMEAVDSTLAQKKKKGKLSDLVPAAEDTRFWHYLIGSSSRPEVLDTNDGYFTNFLVQVMQSLEVDQVNIEE